MAEKRRGKMNQQQGTEQGEAGYQQTRREKLAKNAVQNHDAGYTLAGNGYNIRQKSDKKSAYRELESLQRSAIADYRNWAKEKIKYDNLDSENAASNLKQYNDTYTMSMLMGVISPLENGCDLGAVLQCFMSYNVVKMMNPDLDMDSSRMFYNFKNTVAPMISDMKSDHPILGKLVSPLLSEVDSTLSEAGGAKFATTIDAHEKVHDIDSMYMSPRQVAALKLNFMEQYYADMRTTNDPNVRVNQKADYQKALKHLNAICANGGYDMSVVAEEERYLVSLKIQENPNYMTIFEETTDIFSVKLDTNKIQESQRWAGYFISADEHEYYGRKDLATNGTFHVREPMTEEKLRSDVADNAGYFCDMKNYVSSDLFSGDAKAKKDLLREIEKNESQYLERMQFVMKTDGIKSRESIYDIYDEAMADAVNDSKNKQTAYGVNLTYLDEMQNVTLNKVAKRMGYDPNAMRDNPRRVFDKESAEYQKMMAGMAVYVENGKNNGTMPSDMTPERALENIQLNYFKDLSTEDQYSILAHVTTNVKQGYKEHQSDRYNIRKEGVSPLRDVYADLDLNVQEEDETDAEDDYILF